MIELKKILFSYKTKQKTINTNVFDYKADKGLNEKDEKDEKDEKEAK